MSIVRLGTCILAEYAVMAFRASATFVAAMSRYVVGFKALETQLVCHNFVLDFLQSE